ncbi:class I SAM-dependent methyltransferase [Candidatus Woesearchaeota archaeon]|nr:MAG: class I SAM-dependent methyltransferase [Candidatus Woesearchaeota archaeon]
MPDFYEYLPQGALLGAIDQDQSRDDLRFVFRHCNKKHKILDVACGEGRHLIPLRARNYAVEGVDSSKNLLRHAKAIARKKGIKISVRLGTMERLPYPDKCFDRVFCMWSSFNHLLQKEMQVRALREFVRVLRPKGRAFLDLAYLPFVASQGNVVYGKDKHIVQSGVYKGKVLWLYLHDERSVASLMKSAKIANFKSYTRIFGSSRRLIVSLQPAKNL